MRNERPLPDMTGQTLAMGGRVAYADYYSGTKLLEGVVIGFTRTKIRIMRYNRANNSYYSQPTTKYPRQVVKI